MKRLLLFSALLATSTACTPMPPNAKPSKPFPPQVMRCQAEPGQRFVGQAASDEVVSQAQAATGAKTVRVLKPGMAATMDFRDDRLNLHLDEHDVIVEVGCG
ncbi:MAG TPA: I78 family peptidase inhibitor [Lysobacter sp.]|nr:I78 family peptidase inhibitor [Lysobacter sp.]